MYSAQANLHQGDTQPYLLDRADAVQEQQQSRGMESLRKRTKQVLPSHQPQKCGPQNARSKGWADPNKVPAPRRTSFSFEVYHSPNTSNIWVGPTPASTPKMWARGPPPITELVSPDPLVGKETPKIDARKKRSFFYPSTTTLSPELPFSWC